MKEKGKGRGKDDRTDPIVTLPNAMAWMAGMEGMDSVCAFCAAREGERREAKPLRRLKMAWMLRMREDRGGISGR